MENTTHNTTSKPIMHVEAVISSINESTIELQIAGSYETIQWPTNLLFEHIEVGQKIIIEMKNHPLTNIQNIVQKNKQEGKDVTQQRKLLESLIN